MTPMDPRTRVGDADREQTVAALQRYVSEGYLSLDEFSDRSAAAYQAKTHGELAAVTADLAPRARSGHPAAAGRNRWSPLAIVVAGLVGAVVLATIVMVLMMLGMMGGMGMMG